MAPCDSTDNGNPRTPRAALDHPGQDAILDLVPALIFYKDKENRLLRVNQVFADLFGKTKEELQLRSVAELLPRQAAALWEQDQEVIMTGRPKRHFIVRLDTPKGERWFQVDKIPYRAAEGNILGVLVFAVDVSDRERAELSYRNSEALYQSLVENLPQHIVRKDLAGRFTFANYRVCETFGRPLSEILGKTDFDFFPPELAEKYHQDDLRILQTGKALETIEEHTPLSGKRFFVQVIKTPLHDAERRICGIQGIYWDITEKLNLESQLRQAQKMESIGLLAGGIAHDFNNILTVIQGHASLLQNFPDPTGELRESVQQIANSSERAANLTRQLLTFSRRQLLKLEELDFNEVVNNMCKMLRRILGEDISLLLQFGPVLPLVRADLGMIEQVLMNLAVNARDAMPKGGELVISTELFHASEEYQRGNPEACEGPAVCLSVSDNGCGIPAEVLPRIFEPFFTTKEVGKGTGLGLATVYGIVKQHRGWIEVTSRPSQGTTFRVFFPGVSGSCRSGASPLDENLPRGTETILLVEDEAPLRHLVLNILGRLGYRVLPAYSGVDALRYWETAKEQIALLLTDVVMPEGLNGHDLANRLRHERPELPVIFTSGYSADLLNKNLFGSGPSCFLQKPYPPAKLATLVRACLNSNVAKI